MTIYALKDDAYITRIHNTVFWNYWKNYISLKIYASLYATKICFCFDNVKKDLLCLKITTSYYPSQPLRLPYPATHP